MRAEKQCGERCTYVGGSTHRRECTCDSACACGRDDEEGRGAAARDTRHVRGQWRVVSTSQKPRQRLRRSLPRGLQVGVLGKHWMQPAKRNRQSTHRASFSARSASSTRASTRATNSGAGGASLISHVYPAPNRRLRCWMLPKHWRLKARATGKRGREEQCGGAPQIYSGGETVKGVHSQGWGGRGVRAKNGCWSVPVGKPD